MSEKTLTRMDLTEAVFREVGLSRVLITCDDDNLVSRRVIEGAGGTFAGTLPDLFKPGVTKLLFWVATVAPAG